MRSVERLTSYRIIRSLARSAASEVLLATTSGGAGSERTFVLKIVGEKYARDERFAKVFAREAGAYLRLTHPGIVQAHALLDLGGRPAVALEHVDGAALNRVLGMLRAVGCGIDDTAAFHIAAELFSALAAAHATKDEDSASVPIIHRYLSPSKVLIGWDGTIKIRDFGLPEPTNPNEQTAVGIARGADGYMAPEQVTGKDVAPRSDVYAAAIILWELLTKKRAFQKTNRQVEMWRAMAEPRFDALDVLRHDLDPRVRDLVRRALEPRVENRSVTASEIASVLRELVPEKRGRERVVGLMAMIRHEPSPLPSDLPAATSATDLSLARASNLSRDAIAVRGSMPTLDMSAPPPVAKAAARATAADDAGTSVMGRSGTAALAAKPLPHPRPSGLTRTSSAKIPAVRPSGARPVVLRRQSSGTMPATKVPSDAGEAAAEPTPRAKLVDSASMAERAAPKHTPSEKMVAVTTAPDTPSAVPPRRRSTGRMAAVKPPPLPATAFAAPTPLSPSSLEDAPPSPAGAAPQRVSDETSDPAVGRSGHIVSTAHGSDEPAPVHLAPSDPSSFASVPKVLVIDLARRDPSEPPARSELQQAVVSVAVGPEPELPIEVVSDGTTISEVDFVAERRRKRSTLKTLTLFALLSVGGLLAAQRLGYLRSPLRDEVAYRLHGWLDSAESKIGVRRKPVADSPSPAATVALAIAEPTTAGATPSASLPSPPSSAASAQSTPLSTSASAIAPGMGLLKTKDLAAGRRIFVDERTAGQTPESVLVKCGERAVKIGSSGRRQVVDVPCGGEISVAER
jgi:serine/threonine protein kinase